jgi:hypothetical protein
VLERIPGKHPRPALDEKPGAGKVSAARNAAPTTRRNICEKKAFPREMYRIGNLLSFFFEVLPSERYVHTLIRSLVE